MMMIILVALKKNIIKILFEFNKKLISWLCDCDEGCLEQVSKEDEICEHCQNHRTTENNNLWSGI